MYGSWDMEHDRRTDGRMDRQKKWHTEVSAPPENLVVQTFLSGSEDLINQQ